MATGSIDDFHKGLQDRIGKRHAYILCIAFTLSFSSSGSPNLDFLKAMRAVLPPSMSLLPVGGITPYNMAPYRAAGANGFGLGSALYAPGRSAEQVRSQAAAFVQAWQG
jgi:2-keto-3-deoxy-6-phosphogluconate aldolase